MTKTVSTSDSRRILLHGRCSEPRSSVVSVVLLNFRRRLGKGLGGDAGLTLERSKGGVGPSLLLREAPYSFFESGSESVSLMLLTVSRLFDERSRFIPRYFFASSYELLVTLERCSLVNDS